MQYEEKTKKEKSIQKLYSFYFKGYEEMLENPEINELRFEYLKEETILSRDDKQQIRFRTKDK